MPQVVVERAMRDASPGAVWPIVKNLLDYPKFMEQVISVASLQSADGKSCTAWTVLFSGNELQWTETDLYDEAARRIEFAQIEGDLAEWNGTLEVLADGAGTLVRYTVNFDLGVPALAHVLHPLGGRAIRSNCEQMLAEIELHVRS